MSKSREKNIKQFSMTIYKPFLKIYKYTCDIHEYKYHQKRTTTEKAYDVSILINLFFDKFRLMKSNF